MKLSGLIAASVVAASAVSISSSSSSYASNPCIQLYHQDAVTQGIHEHPSPAESASGEKFAPRLDGLRFIETLVTAHR